MVTDKKKVYTYQPAPPVHESYDRGRVGRMDPKSKRDDQNRLRTDIVRRSADNQKKRIPNCQPALPYP